MWISSIIATIIIISILVFSELFTKYFGKIIFRNQNKELERAEVKLKELRNLIRLAILNNDRITSEKIQKEYSNLYGKVLYLRMVVNSIFLIPMFVFYVFTIYFFKEIHLFMPIINLIILVTGLYFLVKFLYIVYRRDMS